MPNGDPEDDSASHFERLHYFFGQLLSVDDLTVEQDYFREKMRRHNRVLHGWGVAEGLRVNATEIPWEVTVEPGYALDDIGNEIAVPHKQTVPIADHCRSKVAHMLYVVTRYKEILTRPVPVTGTSDNPTVEYSRWRDSFEIGLLEHVPDCHPDREGIAEPRTGPWLVLGAVTADPDGKVTSHHCPLRRHLRRDP